MEDLSLALVPYTEGLITEGLLARPPNPRTKKEHMALHSDVVRKSAELIAGSRSRARARALSLSLSSSLSACVRACACVGYFLLHNKCLKVSARAYLP